MAFTPVTYAPVEDRGWLIREASGLRSRDEVWVMVGATELPSGTVLGGPSTLKGATLVASNIYGQYSASGVSGAATVAGILFDRTRSDAVGVPHKASGRITFSDQPGADSTITLNGEILTFKASGASGEQQSNVGANLAATITAAVAKLNAATTTTAWTVATYYATATTIEIVYDTAGAAGNAYTVVAGSGSNGTALAATLVGGGNLVKAVIINADAEVKELALQWFTGATAPQKAAGLTALRALGIKARPYSTEVTS